MNQNNIADRLLKLIDEKQNPCIVGLDPRMEQMPERVKKNKRDYDNPFEAVRDTFIEFNTLIINVVADIVPAVKLQMAFYEQYGSAGLRVFEETVRHARNKGLLVIEDAKRNDIGSTAKAYAEGHLGRVPIINGARLPSLNVDLITINPYLGSDGINPFLSICKEYGKGIFVLVKTSNPSSGEIQDKMIGEDETVCQRIARYIDRVGEKLMGKRGYSSVGAVVGATYPQEAIRLRQLMPKNIFLVPGYGAQGGRAEDVVHCFNNDGYGAIVSSSRSIVFAYQKEPYKSKFRPEEFYLASRQAAIDMRDDIVSALKKNNKLPGW